MKRFDCDHCGNKVYFENVTCVKCHSALGFDDEALSMRALAADEKVPALYRGLKNAGGNSYRYCANAAHDACNWLIRDGGPATYCKACELNGTVPDLSSPENVEAWQDLERAKKRLIYSIFRFGLPVDATAAGKGRLTFDFVQHAVTGHLDGVITIDILEADAVERERQRQQFDEPYRSLLGHLRHESGHFYWTVLVEGGGWRRSGPCSAMSATTTRRRLRGIMATVRRQTGRPATFRLMRVRIRGRTGRRRGRTTSTWSMPSRRPSTAGSNRDRQD